MHQSEQELAFPDEKIVLRSVLLFSYSHPFSFTVSVSESRDTLVERYNRAAYASRILSEAYQVCMCVCVLAFGALHTSSLGDLSVVWEMPSNALCYSKIAIFEGAIWRH